jgi:hypothetical protein
MCWWSIYSIFAEDEFRRCPISPKKIFYRKLILLHPHPHTISSSSSYPLTLTLTLPYPHPHILPSEIFFGENGHRRNSSSAKMEVTLVVVQLKLIFMIVMMVNQ